MKLSEFITKYNGKKIDFDHALGFQCVDLYRFYLKEVLNIPQTSLVIGAYQLFDTWPFEKFENTPTGIPQKGDIMIWDKTYGQFGHVGVVVSADLGKFEAFEQNDPIGSACQLKTYNYTKVIGWLRPQGTQLKTQNYKGELRLVIPATDENDWKSLTSKFGVDPNKIDETIE